jgi:hypothetical protein
MAGYHESIKFDVRVLNGPGVLAAVVRSATHHPVALNHGGPPPQWSSFAESMAILPTGFICIAE